MPDPGKPHVRDAKHPWRRLLAIGAMFVLIGGALLVLEPGENVFMTWACALFGAVCLGVGFLQMRSEAHGTSAPLSHGGLVVLAFLFSATCLVLSLGAFTAEDADFASRYPRWLGMMFGPIGTLFFGAAGIYGLVKGPRA